MPRTMRPPKPQSATIRLRSLVIALAIGSGGTAGHKTLAANDTESVSMLREEISTLAAEIGAAEENLAQAREDSFALSARLEPFRAEQRAIDNRLSSKRAQVRHLDITLEALQSELNPLLDAVGNAAIQQFVLANQPLLKIVLNQPDTTSLKRQLAYYRYLTREHDTQLSELQQKLNASEEIRAALELEQQELLRLRQENETSLAALESTREALKALITTITDRMAEKGERLEILKDDERRLRNLVDDLDRPAPSPKIADFRDLKGRLVWPASGKVSKAPGSALRDGGATWSGVLIGSRPGTAVRVIASGQVVFSDWFRNLGKLVIVDHGNGFLTLYGNNDQVFRRAGDTVESGDTIATVGPGNGDMPAGLYFEIRESGRPLDPRQWFASR